MIYYSYKIKKELIDKKERIYSKFHQVCKQSKDIILDYLTINNINSKELIRPEMYKHKIAFDNLPEFEENSIHLIFKPVEEIKIVKNTYNIAILNYPVIFLNHLNRLKLNLLDEIWTNSIIGFILLKILFFKKTHFINSFKRLNLLLNMEPANE